MQFIISLLVVLLFGISNSTVLKNKIQSQIRAPWNMEINCQDELTTVDKAMGWTNSFFGNNINGNGKDECFKIKKGSG